MPDLLNANPRIVVIGLGLARRNPVNNMRAADLTGIEFVVANTDTQALAATKAEHRIQLGSKLTDGLGAGSKPEIGEAAAEEALEEIHARMRGAHMVFIAAGMGGGTGTGAAYVFARAAKELGILTIAIVTKPFQFEGSQRMRNAEAGLVALRPYVDTLLVIPNENLFRVATDRTTFAEAFLVADQVLYSGIACLVDLIIQEGLINLDLADVKAVLSGMGTAMMGVGEASGQQRAIVAAEEAIVNPLLDDTSLKGAKSLLLSIIGGRVFTLWEVDEAANRVRQEVDPDANIIVGATFDEALGDKVRVSIVASGMGHAHAPPRSAQEPAWTPRATAGAGPHDYRLRLSEAIDEANGAGVGAGNGAAEDGWRAPGNVYITERPPELSPLGHATRLENRASSTDDRQPLAERERRPTGHDFPPHAQREYWAASGEGAQRMATEAPYVYHRQPESPGAKGSLLRRLTGGALGRRQPSADAHLPKHSASTKAAGGSREEVDLPVFFGRGKR